MKNNIMELLAYRCACHEEKLYCLTRDFNLLYSVDLQNGKVELIDTVPGEPILSNIICGFMTIWNDKLILTPNRTRKIWIYHLTSRQWDSLPIKEYDNYWRVGGIHQTYVYKNKLFLVGGDYPAILCLDMENNSCDYIDAPYKEIQERHSDINYLYFRSYGVKQEGNLYLASCLDNFVLKFNMDTLDYQWIKVGDDTYSYGGIAWDSNNFWLSPRFSNGIVKWNGQDDAEILPLDNKLEQPDKYEWDIHFDGKHIVLPAATHTKSIQVDIHNNSLQLYEQQYCLYTQLDNGLTVSQTENGDLSISSEGSLQKTYHIAIEAEQLKQFYQKQNLKIFDQQTLYRESSNSSLLSLKNFLNFTESTAQNKPESHGKIGKAIWEAIR